MGIDALITDPFTKSRAEVDTAAGERQAAIVAIRTLKTYEPFEQLLTNGEYGADMNQDASAGGTPVKVHDGIDSALWTASAIQGAKFTFNSTDEAHGGTKSVKTDNAAVNDEAQFDKGSNLTVSSYVSLTLWIYVDKDWKTNDDIQLYGWDTGTSLQVGTAVGLQDYFSWSTFDTWLKVAIPLEDMGLTSGTIDALRYRIVAKEGKSPKFYLDDVQFEQTGALILFEIEPVTGTWLHLERMRIIAVAAYDTDEANGTLPGLAWDDLLGVTLISGLIYQLECAEKIDSQTFKTLADFLQYPGMSVVNAAHDGTDTLLAIEKTFARGTILKSENADVMRYIVQDDLSGFLLFRASVQGYVETR